MKVIVSPAKNMNIDSDFILPKSMPVFIEKADRLLKFLKELSLEELRDLLSCNEEIAMLNYERYQSMNLFHAKTPAILAFEGIQYKYMAPHIFEDSYFEYVEKNLRILSGFYGILKPFDAVTPYRLEMQAKIKTNFCINLYDYWGKDIYSQLVEDDDIILNLASSEYSKTIKKFLTSDIRFIDCVFGEHSNGKIKEKGVYVKMARGEMVRYMAEKQIKNPEGIKSFNRMGFKFSEVFSDVNKYIFIKE